MVLVTGATGFIGSHLVNRLAASSRVRCLVRPASFDKIKSNASIEVMTQDLASHGNFGQALEGVQCIVHLAALLRKKDPAEIQEVNVGGTLRLVEAARKYGVKRFIYVSTENALRTDLKDSYAATKREAEKIVQSFPNYLILRPCFVYGRGDHHGLGRLMELAQKSCVVPLFGGLKSKIQPIYIDDIVEILIRAVQNNQQGQYVVAGPETINLNEFVERALKAQGLKRVLIPVPYFFYYLAALLGDSFLRSSGWGMTQLKNIYQSQTYSIEETIKAFDHKPRDLAAGFGSWFTSNAASNR